MDNYLKFDETVLSDDYIVTKIVRNWLPKKAISTVEMSARDGQIFNGAKYGSLDYQIELIIEGVDEYDYNILKQDLINILSPKDEVPVAFSEERTGNGIVTSEVNIEDKSECKGVATFTITCLEPYFYNNEIMLYENEEEIPNNVTLVNNGGLPAKPLFSLGMSQDAHFVQIENEITKERILIGRYPQLELSQAAKIQYLMRDNCSDLSLWTQSFAPLAPGRGVGGTFSLGAGSGGNFVIGSFGSDTSTTWKGAAYRQNLSDGSQLTSCKEFEANIRFKFKSTGKNGDPTIYVDDVENIVSGIKIEYYKVTSSTLNYRTGPGTKYKKLGSVKKGFEIVEGFSVVKGWLKFPYKNKTCYCSLKYLKRKFRDGTKTTTKQNYVTNQSTPLRDKPDLKGKKLASIPLGTVVRCISSKKYTSKNNNIIYEWYKLATPYKKISGYVCVGNLVEAGNMTINKDAEYKSSDEKTGICEVYGMATDGAILFRTTVEDNTQWWENNQISMYVGNRKLFQSSSQAPLQGFTNTTTGNSDKVTGEIGNIHGGTYGIWNDLNGEWYISRKMNKNGSYTYKIQLRRVDAGVIKDTKTVTYTTTTAEGTQPLSYIVLYIGNKDNNTTKMSDISFDDVKIKSLDEIASTEIQNVIYFKEGDIIDVDCQTRKVYVNETLHNDLVDIGSRFFDVNTGETPVKIISDDNNIVVSGAIQERWVGGQ